MRKPLNSSERASGPEPQTSVLASGQSFQEKFGGPVALESIDADRHVKRIAAIEAGEIGLDRVQNEDIDKLIRHSTMETRQDRLNLAAKLLGQTPMARIVRREIADVAQRQTSARQRGARVDPKSIAQLSTLDGAPGSAADKLHRLRKVHEAMGDRRAAGAMFRKQTGFGIGHGRVDEVILLDDDDRPVIRLASDTAQMLAGDRRFDKALKLLKQAHLGGRPENLTAQIAAAIKAAEGGARDRAIGDGWVFEETADRIKLAEGSFRALSRPGLPPAARALAIQTLTTALAAETMPRERGLQMLMDTVPLLGNLRAAEATIESGKAALAAYRRGDNAAGGREAIATLVNAFGAVAGTATPVAAVAKRSVIKVTLQRNKRLKSADTEERRQAKLQGVPEAARQRAEGIANKKFGTQFTKQEWEAYNAKLDELPQDLQKLAKNHTRQIVGRSGEYFMHDIIKRWKPGTLTGAELDRLRAIEVERGFRDITPELSKRFDRLKFSRDGKTVHADGIVPDAQAISEGRRLRLKNLKPGNNLPMAAEVKTGSSRSDQKFSYAQNGNLESKKYKNPRTLNSTAFFKPSNDEWRVYFDESIQFSMKELIVSGKISKK